MKKNNFHLLLILLYAFSSCKTIDKSKTVYIAINASASNPVELGVDNFFTRTVTFNLIDTLNFKKRYRFVPGAMFLINRDTILNLFHSDTIIIDNTAEKPIIYSSNKENSKYNRVLIDLSNILSPVYESSMKFFQNKTDSILRNENFIDRYLTEKYLTQVPLIDSILNFYNLSPTDKSEIREYILETKKLFLSFSYFKSTLSKMDSLQQIKRFDYYISKINRQAISFFSQGYISVLIDEIAYQLTKLSITSIKNKKELQDYYIGLRHYFTKKTVAYDYLVSALQVQAKKADIKLLGPELRQLHRDTEKSIFKKFVQKKYNSLDEDLKDAPEDMSLYSPSFKSTTLSKIITDFQQKPILIDFWASWCLPCLKKIPETVNYKIKYPTLNFIFISLDKSQDAWKIYLYHHLFLKKFPQFRRNYKNQDAIFEKIKEIPRYGLVSKTGTINLFTDLTDSLLKNYTEKF